MLKGFPRKQSSLEKSSEKRGFMTSAQSRYQTPSNLANTNTIQQHFNLILGSAVPDPSDVKIAWHYNIPVITQNQRKLFLDFDSANTLLIDYGSTDFPQSIYLRCREIDGYLDMTGNATHNILTLNVSSVAINPDATGITRYTVTYRLCGAPPIWNLGLGRTLTFQIAQSIDGTSVDLPIVIPIQLSFKVIHVSY